MHKVFLCRKEKHAWWQGEAEGGVVGWREGGGGVILSHCLIGRPVCFCICGSGVTDARGCSAQLGAASPHSPCQKCCSRTHGMHMAASATRGWGVRGGGQREGVIEDCCRYSWWRQVKHVLSSQGLACLQRPDLSGSSRLWI